MIRRQARLRREYLYRKSIEDRQRAIQEKKDRLKHAVEENKLIDSDIRRKAIDLHKAAEWDDNAPEAAWLLGNETGGGGATHVDDEYRWSGVDDPKVVITTSRDPSSRLKMFSKELRLIIPNAQRLNRGNYERKHLIDTCRANGVTDFIMVEEHRGEPNCMVVCHLPYGPTAYFTMSDVVMRHDIPNIGTMSEQYPHLIFHNFKSPLGKRVSDVLKYLYPVPKEDSKRVVTFANHDDYISFRQHMYKKVDKTIELAEIGPRFQLRLFKLIQGTIDQEAPEIEWTYRPYMNTTKKRRFLSDENGWVQE